jgi:glycerophosphoryl diester phosphodiesterase
MADSSSTISSARFIVRAFGTVRRSLSAMLWYELFFKLLAAAVLAPLAARLMTAFIRSTGSVAVSNEAIVGFLTSPRGLAAVVVVGAVSLAILFFEVAGLILIAGATERGERADPWRTLRAVGRRFPRLVNLGALLLVGVLLVLAPFAAGIWLVKSRLLSESDIYFYITVRPPEFWVAAGLAGVIALAGFLAFAMLYVRWILALPVLLFESSRPWSALWRSWRLVRPGWRPVAGAMIGWLLIAVALGTLAQFLFDASAGGVLGLGGDRTGFVIAAVAGLVALHVVGSALLSALVLTVDGSLVAHVYFALAEPSAEALPGDLSAHRPPRTSSLRLAWLAVLAFLAVAAVASARAIGRLDLDRQVAVTAHRGSSVTAPENTLSAVSQAIADGADYAEIDVQLSADSAVVVIHDVDVRRVAGISGLVSDMTLAELRQLDVGSWFSAEFAGEPLPTLQEVIDLARGRIKLNIELKMTGSPEGLVERVVALVERNDFGEESVITSLNEAAVRAVKRRAPDLRVGFIVATAIGDPTRMQVDLLAVSTQFLSAGLIRRAHRRNMEVHVWTVNTRQRMWAMIERGVDNIMTDYPPRLLEVIEERAELNNAEKVLLAFRSWLAE